MKHIHIVFIVHSFGIGGLENVVANLANRLDPTRFKVSIVSLTNNLESCARLTRKDVNCVVIGKKEGNDWSVPFRLSEFLKKENASIVHTHGWGTYLEGILAAKLARVPVIIHAEHGTDHLEKIRRRVGYRLGTFWVNKIVTVCEVLRDRFIHKYQIPERKILTIRNGVDTKFFQPDNHLRNNTRQELGFSEQDIVVGTIGRLNSVKNYEMLLRVGAQVIQENSNVYLLIAGDGPERNHLTQLAAKLSLGDHIRFLGMRDDRLELLNAMDVFALTSISEGLPITLLEAMSIGVPVISTNVGGISELVVSPKEGVLVESQNIQAFVEKLMQLIQSSSLRVQIGSGGQKRVLSHFTLDSMVHAYEETYWDHVARQGGNVS